MLKLCDECGLQVSDKALSCPHCGLPMSKISQQNKPRFKFRRLPNGFGQITKLNNQNLRKPYRAMVTIGTNSKGRPICKILKPQGYFKTYNEAYEALVEYNKNPYDLNDDITVQELYDRWSKEYFKTLKNSSSVRTITSSWSYCSEIYDMRVKDLRARHIKGCMEHGTALVKSRERKASANTKTRIKSLFNLMLDYALEYELVDKNYSRTFTINENIKEECEQAKRGHLSFTDDEMEILWENKDNPIVRTILIQCYMGWRPQELGLLELRNVNTVEKYIIGGMKTRSGTNRKVPIHDKIIGLIEINKREAMAMGSKYLFNCTDSHTHRSSTMLTYDKYQKRFKKTIEELGLNPDHRAHDGRKHFVTMCKRYNVDEYAIKRMVGHNISDITEKVYTDRGEMWLYEEISKII